MLPKKKSMALQIQRTPRDYTRIASETDNLLAAQAALEQQLYNARKVFQVTGQLIDPTPPDMRSAADKFADVEMNRINFKKLLMTITDGANADIIVNSVPVNKYATLIQGWPQIEKFVKLKYQFGIPAIDFVTYVKTEYIPDLDTVAVADIGNGKLISSYSNIINTSPTIPEIADLRQTYERSLLPETQKVARIHQCNLLMQGLGEFNALLSEIAKLSPEEQGARLIEINQRVLENLITKNEVIIMLRNLNEANAFHKRQEEIRQIQLM